MQGLRKTETYLGLEDEESTSDINMEKAEALMMAEAEKEREPTESDQNEINRELGTS